VLRVGTGEEGEEDGDGEDEPLHAGLRRAKRRLAASGGCGSRCGRDSGAFAVGGKGRRRCHLVAGDLRHVSTGRRSGDSGRRTVAQVGELLRVLGLELAIL
jgi:hypothetical protein